MKNTSFIALTLAACFALMGCESISQTNANQTLDLAKIKTNQVITLKKGATAQVKVRENPSTGYHWATTASNSAVKVTKGTYQSDQSENNSPMAGVPGTRIFIVQAAQAGPGTVVFKLFAPGKTQTPVKTKTVQFQVEN